MPHTWPLISGIRTRIHRRHANSSSSGLANPNEQKGPLCNLQIHSLAGVKLPIYGNASAELADCAIFPEKSGLDMCITGAFIHPPQCTTFFISMPNIRERGKLSFHGSHTRSP